VKEDGKEMLSAQQQSVVNEGHKFSVTRGFTSDNTCRKLAALAAEGRIRVLGICFGHQILAQALGGQVTRHESGLFLGKRSFCVEPNEALLWREATCSVMYSHSDVVSLLPPGALSLGGSVRCNVEGMVVGRHMLSLQGHPELSTASPSARRCMRVLTQHFAAQGMATREVADEALADAGSALPNALALQQALILFLRSGLCTKTMAAT